jgi:chromate reductase, NAD(P)H dehydrogenase (quinone)
MRTIERPGKRVLALAGSLRHGSYNRRLLEAAAAGAPPGLAMTLYEEMGELPLFNEDLEAPDGRGPEAVQRLRRQVAEADGLLFATPEYNHSIPGVLKNTLDWLSREAPDMVLAGKPVAVIGATGGRWGTRLAQSALRQVLFATESLVLPAPALFVAEAGKLFDPAGRLIDRRTREQLVAVLAAFADWIDRVGDRPEAEVEAEAVPVAVAGLSAS